MNEPIVSGMSPFVARLIRRAEAAEAERDAAIRRAETAEEALSFYADPETYFAVAFWFDPPTGAFEDDFDEDYSEWTDFDFDRPMPGKTARAALRSNGRDPAKTHADGKTTT